MLFEYEVRDPLGNTHRGTLEAASRDLAHQQLVQDGFRVLRLEPLRTKPALSPLGRRVNKRDIVYTTNQLAIMVDTGISLSAALGGILEQENNPAMQKLLKELKSSVEAGENFSNALARYPKLFDKTYIAMVKAAEASGGLGTMLERVAGYLRKELDTRSRIRAAMAYPAVMLVMAIGVTIFLLTYVLPRFVPIFEARKMELPTPTRVVMAISDVFLNYPHWWLAGAVAAVVGIVLAKRTRRGQQVWDWVKLHMPVLGPLYRKIAIVRSIRTLQTLLAADVPMLDALTLCAETAGNYYYEQLWLRVREDVTAGRRICDSLAGSDLIPPVLVQMIASGEESGRLPFVLERISTYYENDVETSIKAATSLIEPVMIGTMGVVVGGIGLAMLLPIFSLSKHP